MQKYHDMKRIILLTIVFLLFAHLSGAQHGLFCYDHASLDSLFWIDPATGDITGLQDNEGDDAMAMAYDVEKEISYFFTGCMGDDMPRMQKLDMKTYVITSFPRSSAIIYGAAFDNLNHILYAVGMPEDAENEPQTLYTVDTSTSNLTPVGLLGVNGTDDFCGAYETGINALAYDRSLDILYGVSYNNFLFSINPVTGAASVLGIVSPVLNGYPISGLTYNYKLDILYAVDVKGNVYELNKSNGSVLNTISSKGSFDFVTALAYIYGGILPVEMYSFSGKKTDNGVRLSWKTISEENSDYFVVERKSGENRFIPIGKVNAGGNSDNILEYTFYDNEALNTINYYRLKQVDFNENFEYSSIIFIENTENEFPEFSISELYPNPAGDELKIIIHTDKNNEKVSISIHDIYGRELISNEEKLNSGENIIRFDLKYLSAGIYNLSISDSENTGFKRFVKN